ncbi:serine hydrolase domain-containing protein [Alteraurantiacibacter aquimixticola]|uniref:Class A beta-lactamase-related serine hydrolase n=1 Tax=Alteraurantiacibacter aquimixticola TaxID=2489173 RepID=A0A4V4U8G0_9SPHN|nr:serine hydrolase domain-containing protein [Alteraurantiacibacter aquimixticola]TIX49800.1 class A beta-lactamase-related serine hydrolase [Alteraurantiacibacter aquimixticola]
MDGISKAISRRDILRGAGAAGVSLAALPLISCSSGGAGTQAADWPNVAAMIERYRATGKIANMQVMLGQGADTLLMGGGLDAFDTPDRPSNVNSLYRLYSMTKPIVGMATMLLIAEGKMRLDQELAEILPAFENMAVQKEYDGPITSDNLEPAERPITIRHMLTHTSGLGYAVVQQGPLSDTMKAAGAVTGLVGPDPAPHLARGEPVATLAEFADIMARMPLTHQPGTRWSYSTGLDLMGRVIEVVAEQDFEEFLTERIFEPCKMDSTFFRVPNGAIQHMTTNYDVQGEEPVVVDGGMDTVFQGDGYFPMGGTGLVSSPHDYDRFLAMIANSGQLDGVEVLPGEAVTMGTSDLLPDPSVTQGSWVEGYRFGAAGRLGWAGMDHAYGWAGSAGTVGFVDRASGLRVGVYTQYMPASSWPIADDLQAAVMQDLALR